MDYKKAMEQLKNGKAGQWILFYGEEEYLKAQGVKKALDALNIDMPELNLSVFEDRPEAGDVLSALETLPFMSGAKAVVIKNTEILSTGCAAEYSEKIAGAILPENNYLIISAKGNPDKRKKLVKRIEKEGILVDCSPLTESQFVAFVEKGAGERNLMISRAHAQLLAELCGNDMQAVENELEKLAAVCRGNITKEEIETYVPRSLQYNVYRIHDLFCAKDGAGAKAILEQQQEDNPNPIRLIYLVADNFRQMLVARACRDAGFPEGKTISHIVEETGAREWVARRAIKNCKNLSARQIRDGIKKLGEMDFDAKQGNIVLKTDLFPLLAAIYTGNC